MVAGGPGVVVSGRRRRHAPDHDHSHHDHSPHDHSPHDHSHHDHSHGHDHSDSHHDHDHGRDHGHHHRHEARRPGGRLGLAGIGLAGGLVPSPSALVVLLGAIGLGRAGFGVLLVLAYGLGMAGTLVGAGLLLLAVQRRLARTGWVARLAARLAPLGTRLRATGTTATA